MYIHLPLYSHRYHSTHGEPTFFFFFFLFHGSQDHLHIDRCLPSIIKMKLSLIAVSLSSLAALANANPVKKQVFNVGLTFYGVDGFSYGETFPADTTSVRIS